MIATDFILSTSPDALWLWAKFFGRGMIIGLSIAAPVGPIGLLCIKRSLTQGRVQGFVSGLGAATADAIYAALSGFALSAAAPLLHEATWPHVAGAVFLFYLGWRAYFARSPTKPALPSPHAALASYGSALVLTLANPLTIASFAAVFAGLGALSTPSRTPTVFLVVGAFCGSALWWLILSCTVARMRHVLSPVALHAINRASGLMLMAFGV